MCPPGTYPLRVAVVTLMAAVTLAWPAGAMGQVDRVRLTVPREGVGLGGVVRPGTWTPLRVVLDNPSPEPRRVVLQWTIGDSDEDTVLAQRVVTLTPQREGQLRWLYACPPLGPADPPPTWQVSAFEWDEENKRLGRRLVDPVTVTPARTIPAHKRAIGLTSTGYLGLDPFEDDVTQHEQCEYLRGMDPAAHALPDRWHGLAMMEAFIWTGDGGDPGDPGVPTEAIRQWVQRGGHLVIVLSNSLGWEPWAKSPLASVLPGLRVERVEGVTPPRWFGRRRPDKIDYFRLQATGEKKPTIVLEDDQGRAVVAAAAYGFGRVTVLGLDLTDPKVRGVWHPYGGENLWNVIFRWRTPAFVKGYVESQRKEGHFQAPMFTTPEELGRFIPVQVSRSQTIAAALLLAMLVFAAYWLAAGPVGFSVLRGRGAVRHSWLAFIAVVGGFTVITWGGAMLLRPTRATISHLTVLDIDGATRTVHARSWMSMFVPEHGHVEITVAPDEAHGLQSVGFSSHLWSSPGFDPRRPESGYVDRQAYAIDAAAPARGVTADPRKLQGIRVPMRATTKSMHVDYLGPLQHESPWLGVNWVMPVGDVKLRDHLPTGQLRHGLPGALHNTLLIYCPGGDETPWVVDYGTWSPGTNLEVNFTTKRPLVVRPAKTGDPWGGFLAQIKVGGQTPALGPHGQPDEDAPKPLDASSLMRHLWMLSFFGTLPPPEYEARQDKAFGGYRPANLGRSVGRELDITALTGLKRLIVIGMIERSPLPVPMSVDGRRLDADGWTVVRWHLDLE